MSDEKFFKLLEEHEAEKIVYGWDFDKTMFYIFEIDDWERIEGTMYVSTPFAKEFVIEIPFANSLDTSIYTLKCFIRENADWKKYLKCPVVYYSFKKPPELLGKLKEIL